MLGMLVVTAEAGALPDAGAPPAGILLPVGTPPLPPEVWVVSVVVS